MCEIRTKNFLKNKIMYVMNSWQLNLTEVMLIAHAWHLFYVRTEKEMECKVN